TLAESFALTPVLTEAHGLTNRRPPKCQFTVYVDRPPTVKVLTPDDKVAVRPDDTIQITFSASDDVGIESAELLVYDEAAGGEEQAPLASIPIPLGEHAGARSVQESVALDLNQFMVEDGMELSYEIRVREDRGASQAQATAAADTPASQSGASQSSASQPSASQPSANQTARSQLESAPSSSRPQVASNENQPQQSPAAAMPTDTENTRSGSKASRTTADGTKPNAGPGDQKSGSPRAEDLAANLQASPVASPPSSKPQPRDSAPRPNAAREAAKPSEDAEKLASDETQTKQEIPRDASAAPNKETDGEQSPRTATTGRQALSANRPEPSQPARSQNSQASAPGSNNNPATNTANSQQANNTQQQRNNSAQAPNAAQQSNAGQQSQQRSQAASGGEQQPSSPGDRPPGDSMPRRSLDIAQSASSQRMRLSVDEWAGSFEGQQRAKLEMAISPELEALDKALEKGQKTARGVLDELEADATWRGTHDRDVTSAERSTVEAQERVSKLQERTKDTPYAFIGLQVTDISLAHIGPARSGFWKALESEGEDRVTSVRDAWQHLGRARQLVAELRGQYERTRREFQLAESVEKVKKMYQVYIENSQALLQMQDSDPTRFARKMAQFELDDEYLKRLKEVLEMRRDLQAELARILAEDPRLLRRFMDSLRYRSNNLREELAGIVTEQADLNREVRAWALVDDADRPKIAKILLLKQVQDASKIATAAGELQSRYQTWLPLDRESKDEDLAAATKTIQEMATAAGELNAAAQKFVADAQRATVKDTAPKAEESTAETEAAPANNESQQALDAMLGEAESLYERLNKLEVALRQLSAREEGAEAALFAANRLVDTRRLVADTSAWVRQIRAHKAGNYTGAAEVDQYRLAMKTDQLAGKLGTLEQSLAALLLREDGKLPAPIAEKAREFLATLDKQVSPNQLASVYALHSNQLPRATQRQKAAGEALTKAEHAYDELMRLAIEELDKLPVQDPVADLLDDPTLDELLAQLEQELPIEELLGIPNRPSNLRIIGDWLRPGSGMGGGSGQMVMNQMRQDQERARQQLNRAYQRALARALKEATPQRVAVQQPVKLSDWNRLVSKLGDDLRQGRDKAPPEQYRRAIEQYFTQISSVVAENEDRPK
ncbi:MAG TPA: Ig-like domain-containing protein, partial [Lacipirellulaceae bacterium]|nr:Ig-like domain-containing protein [Lacipirellulaceae bacterium]